MVIGNIIARRGVVKRKIPQVEPGKATMADVAARAGVSKMTVSRVLNNVDRRVSETTTAAVQRAAGELGYVIDSTARVFSSKRSGFIAAVIPSINNSNFSDTVRGITAAFEGSGLQLLLGSSDYRIESEEKLVEAMLQRRPEGVILVGGRHTARTRQLLEGAAVPVVETWDQPEQPIGHVVGFSNAAATQALVVRLHERGYRNIAFIGGSSNRDTRGADRRAGYARALKELGIGRSRVISFGQPPISMAQGGEAIVQLIEQWPDVDAAVCVSDLSAFGALMECQRRGWDVPGRIAIAGFGDFEVAHCSHPRLTTVAVDCHEIGRAAGDVVLRAVAAAAAGQPLALETVLTPYRIVEREST